MAFLGEIRMFAGGRTPTNWVFCEGQELVAAEHPALYAAIGETYGRGKGDGAFKLPDLRGRVAVGHGQGDGLGLYPLGQGGGHSQVKLEADQLGGHWHAIMAASGTGTANQPAGRVPAGGRAIYDAPAGLVAMAPSAIGPAGGHGFHDNRQPYTTLNFMICVVGEDPGTTEDSDPRSFIGEVMIAAYDFEPQGWLACDGRKLAKRSNTALYAVVGDEFGPSGSEYAPDFRIPDLRGRVALGCGAGPAGEIYRRGDTGGQWEVALDQDALAGHNHQLRAAGGPGPDTDPVGRVWARAFVATHKVYRSPGSSPVAMHADALQWSNPSRTAPHPNVMPSMGLQFLLCTNGMFPA